MDYDDWYHDDEEVDYNLDVLNRRRIDSNNSNSSQEVPVGRQGSYFDIDDSDDNSASSSSQSSTSRRVASSSQPRKKKKQSVEDAQEKYREYEKKRAQEKKEAREKLERDLLRLQRETEEQQARRAAEEERRRREGIFEEGVVEQALSVSPIATNSWTCEKCGYDAPNRDKLKRHQVVHTNKYEATCSFCYGGIKHKANLLDHVKKCAMKHVEDDAATIVQKNYPDFVAALKLAAKDISLPMPEFPPGFQINSRRMVTGFDPNIKSDVLTIMKKFHRTRLQLESAEQTSSKKRPHSPQ